MRTPSDTELQARSKGDGGLARYGLFDAFFRGAGPSNPVLPAPPHEILRRNLHPTKLTRNQILRYNFVFKFSFE